MSRLPLSSLASLTVAAVHAINTRKSELESMARVRVLAEQLRGWSDPSFRLTNSAHRRLLSEGTAVQVLAATGSEKSEAREAVSWYLFNDFLVVAKAGTVIERLVGVSQEVQHVLGQFWCKDSMWRPETGTGAVQLFRKGLSITLQFESGASEFVELIGKHLQPWDDVQVIVFQANAGADKKERRHRSTRQLERPPVTSDAPVAVGSVIVRDKEKERERRGDEKKEKKHTHSHSHTHKSHGSGSPSVPVLKGAASPSALVAAPASPHPRSVPSSSPASGKQAVALYAYQATEATEVSFTAGELISLLSTESPDWYYGCTADGRAGYFPATYVSIKS